jgi:hypothetical protein
VRIFARSARRAAASADFRSANSDRIFWHSAQSGKVPFGAGIGEPADGLQVLVEVRVPPDRFAASAIEPPNDPPAVLPNWDVIAGRDE